jgi:hypothetical protein
LQKGTLHYSLDPKSAIEEELGVQRPEDATTAGHLRRHGQPEVRALYVEMNNVELPGSHQCCELRK